MEQSAASFDCTLSLHIAMCSYRYVHVNDIAKFIQNLQSMQIVINLGGRGGGGWIHQYWPGVHWTAACSSGTTTESMSVIYCT